MNDAAFLKHLWPGMCAAYRDAALARACLAAQEKWQADVPLLLVLCLAEKAGHAIARPDLEQMISDSASWREAVIMPLRQARQQMKGRFTAPAETALREQVKQLELEAEHLHVLRLVQAFPAHAPGGGSAPLLYLSLCGATAAEAEQFLATFHFAHEAQVLPARAQTDGETGR